MGRSDWPDVGLTKNDLSFVINALLLSARLFVFTLLFLISDFFAEKGLVEQSETRSGQMGRLVALPALAHHGGLLWSELFLAFGDYHIYSINFYTAN